MVSCLSVPVTLVDCDHTCWNSSKIISRLISLTFFLSADPTSCIYFKGNTLNFSLNRSGVGKNVDFYHATLYACLSHLWTVQPTIIIASPYGSPMILDSGNITFIPKFEGVTAR